MTEILVQLGASFGAVVAAAPVQIGARLIVVSILLVWVAAAIWIFFDGRSRMTGHLGPYLAAGAAIIATPVLAPLVWSLYRLLRPRWTAQEAAQRRRSALVPAAAAPRRPMCPACQRETDVGLQTCPYCSTEIGQPCPRCAAVAGHSWTICAFCAYDLWLEDPVVAPVAEPQVLGPHHRPAQAIRPIPLG